MLWLADQIESLRGPLLCCEDKSGSSYFYRSVIDRSLDKKLASSNEDLIDWLRNLDTSPAVSDDIESSPMYAAACQASISNYEKLYGFFITRAEETSSTQKLKQSVDKFLLSKTANDYDQYLESIPENLGANKLDLKKKFIQSQLKALSLNASKIIWDDYARTAKSIWPFISDDEKNALIKDAVFISNDHKELVLGLLDCELKDSTLDEIYELSARKQNSTAFEFAAERSIWSSRILNALKMAKDVGLNMFESALKAGSLKWIEKLIDAGFDLKEAIDSSAAIIIRLADVDPQGIAKKFNGLDYKITSLMIEQTKTEAGKQALTALMTKANNHG